MGWGWATKVTTMASPAIRAMRSSPTTSYQQSIMSYFSQTENFTTGADHAYLLDPMAADWVALNDLYGGQGFGTGNAFNGNTVWGVNSNISAAVNANLHNLADLADTNAFCIVDGSGIDTVDFSNNSFNQTINLADVKTSSTTGSISSVCGLVGNMTIAAGTIIENATGGSGNDEITGNGANNLLRGNAGNDTTRGDAGNDVLMGGAGNDQIYGGEGNDTLRGQAGADTMYGGFQLDIFIGGTQNDVFDWDLAIGSTPAARDSIRSGRRGGGVPGRRRRGGRQDRRVRHRRQVDKTGINDTFLFGGTGIGRLSLVNSGARTLVRGNSDNDAAFEFELKEIQDGAVLASAYTAADFFL